MNCLKIFKCTLLFMCLAWKGLTQDTQHQIFDNEQLRYRMGKGMDYVQMSLFFSRYKYNTDFNRPLLFFFLKREGTRLSPRQLHDRYGSNYIFKRKSILPGIDYDYYFPIQYLKEGTNIFKSGIDDLLLDTLARNNHVKELTITYQPKKGRKIHKPNDGSLEIFNNDFNASKIHFTFNRDGWITSIETKIKQMKDYADESMRFEFSYFDTLGYRAIAVKGGYVVDNGKNTEIDEIFYCDSNYNFITKPIFTSACKFRPPFQEYGYDSAGLITWYNNTSIFNPILAGKNDNGNYIVYNNCDNIVAEIDSLNLKNHLKSINLDIKKYDQQDWFNFELESNPFRPTRNILINNVHNEISRYRFINALDYENNILTGKTIKVLNNHQYVAFGKDFLFKQKILFPFPEDYHSIVYVPDISFQRRTATSGQQVFLKIDNAYKFWHNNIKSKGIPPFANSYWGRSLRSLDSNKDSSHIFGLLWNYTLTTMPSEKDIEQQNHYTIKSNTYFPNFDDINNFTDKNWWSDRFIDAPFLSEQLFDTKFMKVYSNTIYIKKDSKTNLLKTIEQKTTIENILPLTNTSPSVNDFKLTFEYAYYE